MFKIVLLFLLKIIRFSIVEVRFISIFALFCFFRKHFFWLNWKDTYITLHSFNYSWISTDKMSSYSLTQFNIFCLCNSCYLFFIQNGFAHLNVIQTFKTASICFVCESLCNFIEMLSKIYDRKYKYANRIIKLQWRQNYMLIRLSFHQIYSAIHVH